MTGFDAYRLSASSRIGSRGNLFLIRPANRVNALVSQSCLISSALIFSWRFRSSPLFSMNSLPILATSFSPKKIFASSTSRWYSVISLSVPLLQQRSRQCSFSFLCPQYSCVPSTMISHFFLYLASSKHRGTLCAGRAAPALRRAFPPLAWGRAVTFVRGRRAFRQTLRLPFLSPALLLVPLLLAVLGCGVGLVSIQTIVLCRPRLWLSIDVLKIT